jgi:hypothetical protein
LFSYASFVFAWSQRLRWFGEQLKELRAFLDNEQVLL